MVHNTRAFVDTGIDEDREVSSSCSDEDDLERWEANDEKREILSMCDLITQEHPLNTEEEDQIVNFLKQVKYVKMRNNFKHLKPF